MCGIFGIINFEAKPFNKALFNVLGIDNDSRGGDSCGIFIDGKSEYGVEETKYYEGFFQNSKLLNKTKDVSIALGHCRKASVGSVNINTAQPVILYEGENPVFVLIHNGTIYNYEELAKKYIPNIDIKGLTDSQVMARIFYYSGYDALKEYIGGSVFFIVDYRDIKPKVLIFKGKSKSYQNSINPSEERPFYYITNKEKGTFSYIFSSIPSFLSAFYPKNPVYTIKENTLCEWSKKGLSYVKVYDRKNMTQTKPISISYNSYQNNLYNDTNTGYNYYGINKLDNFSNFEGCITYNRITGSFCSKSKPLHGAYFVNYNGLLSKNETITYNPFYFYNGCLLNGPDAFDLLGIIEEDMQLKDPCEMRVLVPELLAYCSPIPFYDGKEYITSNDGLTACPYSGDLVLPFCYNAPKVKDGIILLGSYKTIDPLKIYNTILKVSRNEPDYAVFNNYIYKKL